MRFAGRFLKDNFIQGDWFMNAGPKNDSLQPLRASAPSYFTLLRTLKDDKLLTIPKSLRKTNQGTVWEDDNNYSRKKIQTGPPKNQIAKRITFSFINDLNPPQNNVQIFPTYPFHKAHLQANYSLSYTNVPQIPLPFLKPTN